jgi:hypothetical protein
MTMPNGQATILGQTNTETLETQVENAGTGNGLAGIALTAGTLNGVFGRSSNPIASGVYGEHTAGGYGVAGRNAGANRSAVYGENGGPGVAVQGNSASGIGVKGDTTNGTAGVYGESRLGPSFPTPGGAGVHGKGWLGVHGVGEGGVGVAGEGTGSTTGVSGSSVDGVGVVGDSTNGIGVAGSSSSNHGVSGTCTGTGFGVRGQSTLGDGVAGFSPRRRAVYGLSSTGIGVLGETTTGGLAGVYGRVPNPGPGVPPGPPWAGLFDGFVQVTGFLVKSGGGFKIDHPLDQENKYLSHSFVESPDMMNIYNGNVTTDADGDATVVLPDYFEALNRDYQYQLTVIGQFAQAIVANRLKDGSFAIKTDKPNVEVSWQVTGIRQDAWANAHRLQVEEEKLDGHQGKYLTPLEHGQPATMGVYYETMGEH